MNTSPLASRVDSVLEIAMLRKSDISPAWVATEVMNRLGWQIGSKKQKTDPEVYAGCHEMVQQIARGRLRKHDPVEAMKDAIDDQMTIGFPETLQQYYPRKPQPNASPVYAPRDDLTDEDVAYNADRMAAASAALGKHSDALRAWGTSTRDERAARRDAKMRAAGD